MPAIFDATDEGLKRITGLPSTASHLTVSWWIYFSAWPSSGQVRTLFMVANSADRTNKSILIQQDDTGEIYFRIAGVKYTGAVYTPGWHPIYFRWVVVATPRVEFDVDNATTFTGQVAVDFTAWAFDELYLGTDPRIPTGGVAHSVAYYREWAAFMDPTNEWLSPTPVTTSNLLTNTPLHADLLDTTVNDHDWTQIGAGTLTFTSFGGTYEGAFGAWWHMSPAALSHSHLGILIVKSAATGSLGERTIAQLLVTPLGFVYDGTHYTAANYEVELRAGTLPTSSDNVISIGTSTNPVADPLIGLTGAEADGPRSWHIPWRFAVTFKCSTLSGATYAADGFVKAYLNDSLLLSATDIILPCRPDGGGLVYILGMRGDCDRTWARTVSTVPATNSDGSFTSGTPTALVFFDDFDAGSFADWDAISLFSGGSAVDPYTYSDCGGGGGYGTSAFSVPPSSASLGMGVGYHGLYRTSLFPPLDPDPTVEPPPPVDPPVEPPVTIPGGIYYSVSPPSSGILTRHDQYYGDIDKKIPDPTVRTALFGE